MNMTDDELTRTEVVAALADLQEAQQAIAHSGPSDDVNEIKESLPGLRRAVREAMERHDDPDPPEPPAGDLLEDPRIVEEALKQDDPVQWLSDKALESGEQTAGPEALRRVLRHGDRDEAASVDLVEIAELELVRRERAAARMKRVAALEADARPRRTLDAEGKPCTEEPKVVAERIKNARSELREARGALGEVRAMRITVAGARHADSRTSWTGTPPDREWLLAGWLAEGRVHLLTGSGGRGKSRLALQLAAALASEEADWPLPWWRPTADNRSDGGPSDHHHPPTLPRTDAGGVPVVVASWEDEDAEVHRRLRDLPVPIKALGNRLHYVDCAEWGPLWAPQESGSGHVQTVAELTGAGRRLRRLCEREKARLLVIDPLAAAYGSDENVRALVRQYMASWDAWGRAHKCAVLMIGHPPKGGGSREDGDDNWWSGSTDWPAAARGAWALRFEKANVGARSVKTRPERTFLECMKPSYGPFPETVDLEADGVTWRTIWRPQPEAAAGAAVAGKVPGV